MLIQKMLWDDTTEFGGREMFFRGEHAEADCDGRLVVPAGESVSFDTWFNLFSSAKWEKYTRLGEVSVRLVLRGRGSFVLIGLRKDAPAQEKVICEGTYNCNGFEEIEICRNKKINELCDFCFLRVNAAMDTVIAAGEYWVEKVGEPERQERSEPQEHPERQERSEPQEHPAPRLACCICTYKREDFVRRNVQTIQREIMDNPNSPLCGKIEIYISDNGRTLSEEEISGHPSVHIYSNENYGGSAGFARTMIEAVLRGKATPTHLLLMDDDILLHPAVLERTAAFMGLLKEEYRGSILGGAMLSLENRNIQAEGCGYYELLSGSVRRTIRDGMDLTKRENLLLNDSENDANFSGWWYSCIPASLITDKNLPLPLFLHRDDQDFGLRCTEKGGHILQLNGIGIWHPSPSAKHADYIAYYDMRNMLITMINHSGTLLPAKSLKKQLLAKAIQSCLGYRYDFALMYLRGCEEFCLGVEHFRQIAPDKLHRELMAQTDKPLIPVEQVPEDELRLLSEEKRISPAEKIWRYLFPSGEVCYAEAGCNYPSYLGHKKTIYLNVEKTAGYELVMSWKKTFEVVKKLIFVNGLIKRKYLAACEDWKREISSLKTLEFWEQYLKL